MIEEDIKDQVQNRIKTLLFDETINHYRNHEIFTSSSNKNYQFLIWKSQPTDWNFFCDEIEDLVIQQEYQLIKGACDVSTYDIATQKGYKVIALYKK